ncbi:MAG: TorF family putative porin [Rhizomicrobium sp.]
MQRAPFPFLAGLVLAVAMATPAGAGWLAATATVATDYRFRGVSQSDGHPVAQLTLEADLGGDLAAGAFVSPVDFDDDSTSFETDLYLMKGFSIGRTDLSLAAIYYAYPDHRLRAGESRYSAAEITLDASRSWGPATAHASLAWSPRIYKRQGRGALRKRRPLAPPRARGRGGRERRLSVDGAHRPLHPRELRLRALGRGPPGGLESVCGGPPHLRNEPLGARMRGDTGRRAMVRDDGCSFRFL